MSGLVSYSYDPSSEQELSDASNEYQQEKKDQTEKQGKPDLDRERRREDRRESSSYGESRNRNKASSSRREREERPTHGRHKHRRHRHSSSNSESPERERERRTHRRSPKRRSRSPRYRDRSYKSKRDRTPPRTVTSARSPPGDPRSGTQCYNRQEAATLTPEQKVEMALTAMNSGVSIQPGNPYGMSKEKFRSLQNKKKMLWSKDEEEVSTAGATGSVYLAATSSLPVNQEKKDKFSKMMGLKGSDTSNAPSLPTQDLVKYDKTQEDLQKQYDASRVHTHIMKGSGLGYGNYYQV